MRKMFVVARREFNAAVRTKSFLISIFLLPILMGGGALAAYLLKDQVDIQEKRFAVVDRTDGQRIMAALQDAVRKRNETEIFDADTGKQIRPTFAIEQVTPSAPDEESIGRQRFELSGRVTRGELFGFLEIGKDVFTARAGAGRGDLADESRAPDESVVRYQSNSPTYDDFRNWSRRVVEEVVQATRFERAGLDQGLVRGALQPVPLVVKGLSEKDEQTGQVAEAKDENPIVSLLAPAALMFLMFMLIMIGATPAMQGVVEEKMQRIAEMILGSVRPFQLMMGKLLGLMGVSLTLSALYLSAAYWAARHFEVSHLVSPALIAWYVVFLVLAILMYGSLFIAVGAACSDLRDTQTMLWPVMLLAMLPMFVWINVAREPTSSFSTAISFFPFATPMLMLLRLGVPPGIAIWQPIAGLLLMLATTIACVYIAGRVFRVGILMQGKGASFRDLARWIFRG
jgi:ABC-2 type transport system permease protein